MLHICIFSTKFDLIRTTRVKRFVTLGPGRGRFRGSDHEGEDAREACEIFGRSESKVEIVFLRMNSKFFCC